MKTPRKHAELIHLWADGAKIEIQLENGDWIDTDYPAWNINNNYRVKKATLVIAGRTITAPETRALTCGQDYFTPYVLHVNKFINWIWEDTDTHLENLNRGTVFLTKEDAIAATDAIICAMKGTE